jgi:hypothetical protein
MRRVEIARRFDEIVEFSGVATFIDTPVKRYSSGMYVRLAFAVAAHLEPEILLVDEVLAVGDIKFQKKCLGKIGDVAKAGRTVVLVSHQMNQIRRLCERAVWMDNGTMRRDGAASEVLAAYETAMLGGEAATESTSNETRRRSQGAQFFRWSIEGEAERQQHVLRTTGKFRVAFEVELRRPIRNGEHGIALYNAERQLMWGWAVPNLSLNAGTHRLIHEFPTLPLRPGNYQWQVNLWDENELLDTWDGNPEMRIETEEFQHYQDEWNGFLNVPATFSHSAAPASEQPEGGKPRLVTPE